MVKAIFTSAAILVVSYGLGAFMAWDLNAGNWSAEGRGILGILAFAGALIPPVIRYLEGPNTN